MVIRPIVLVFSFFLAITFRYTEAQILAASDYRQDPLIRLGDSLFIFENFTGAQSVYRQAIQKMDKGKDVAGSLYALTRLARTAIEMKDTLNARDYLEKADRIGRDHSLTDLERGVTHKEWAVYYDKTGQDSLATNEFERSLEMLESCCLNEEEILGDIFLDYANGQYAKNKVQSEFLVRQAIEHYSKLDGTIDFKRASAYYLMGLLQDDKGDTELAGNYFNASIEILETNNPSPSEMKMSVYYQIANNLIHKREWLEAIEIYDKIMNWPEKLVSVLINKASAHLGLNDRTAAYQELSDAKQHILKSPDIDWFSLGFINERIGTFFANQGELDSALLYFNLSVNNNLHIQDSFELSFVNRAITEVNLLKGDPETALSTINRALDFAGYQNWNISDESIINNRSVDDFFNPLELKGRVCFELFQKTKDITHLYTSLEIFQWIEQIAEYVRSGSLSESTKKVVSEHFYRAARGALRTLHALNEVSPRDEYVALAFNFIEHNRYAQLFQDLSKARSFTSLGVPESVPKKELEFVASIERLKHKSASGNTINAGADSAVLLEREYRTFREEISDRYPTYFQVRYDNMLNLEQIQSEIGPGIQLFEYLWGDSAVSLVSVTYDTAFLASISTPKINSDLNWLLQWMVTDYPADSLELNFTLYSQLSHGIYSHLMANYLQDNIEQIIVSADGNLALLPFEALVTDNGPANFSTASYLIRSKEIQYAYSTNLLFKNKVEGPLKRPEVLAMAYSSNDANPVTSLRAGYKELPNSAVEVDEIDKNFKRAKVICLKGAKATEAAFRKLAPQFDLIHLALHGVGDAISAENSHLLFRSPNDSLDDKLFAYELYNLPLDRLRLAVLSACETGVGKAYDGEGIFSIARGFAYAGTPSLVMSQWKANDQSTQWVMSHFYHHLNRGVTVSKAMQLAKIDFLNQVNPNVARPYFWAGLVVMGDVSPVVAVNHFWIYVIFVLILLFLGLLLKNKFYFKV